MNHGFQPQKPNGRNGSVKPAFNTGLVCFAVFWSAITLVGDFFIAQSVTMRLWAFSFESTTGLVTHSELKVSRDSDGNTYQPVVHFRYSVGEGIYHGTNYQFCPSSTSGSRRARSVVNEHPVGKEVTVFYRQDNPAQAVLRRGLDGGELFMIVFLTPFNAVMFGLWGGALHSRKQQRLLAQSGGVESVVRGSKVIVSLPRWSPVAAAGIVSSLIAFVASLVVGFATGMDPGLITSSITLALVVGGGLAAYLYTHSKLKRGWYDLVLETDSRVLTLPATFERKAPTKIPFDQVTQAEVEEVWPKSRDSESTPSYAATLVLSDGRRERLDEWSDRTEAESFVNWLVRELPLKEPPLPGKE